MKEKILMLSKGRFDEMKPEIRVSEEALVLEAERGNCIKGSVTVTSINGCAIRAMVFTSEQWMTCEEETIVGTQGEIHYTLETNGFESGELMRGSFWIVSNAGELEIPCEVKVTAPFCDSPIGPISEMDQFAQLARDDWHAALRIFRSKEFARVFLSNAKNRRIYEALIKGRSASMAMDEFLCVVKRKKRSLIRVAQDMIEYENPEGEISGTLVIERSQWGAVRLTTQTEGRFIALYKKQLSEDDFLGSYCHLEYTIHPGRGREQKGAIILETVGQHIRIPVIVRRDILIREKEQSRRTYSRALIDLQRLFIRYNLQQISKSRWLSESGEAISGCMNNSKEPVFRVAEAAWQLMAGDREEAGQILASLNGRELRYHSAIYYCFYLYINALYKNDEHYTEYVSDTIRFYVEGQYKDSWELLYFLNQLTETDAGSHKRRGQHLRTYEKLKEMTARSAVPSPGIFLNAVSLINEDPSLIHEISDFECKILIWAARHECLNRDAVYQFADLAPRMREWHPAYMRALMHFCDIYQSKELLTAVIRQLVLGRCTDQESHRWYRLGIESSLKTPELYELFMESLDLNSRERLPVNVLVYYQYDNRLDTPHKAYLYRYILENKDDHARLFEGYDSIIRAFALEQLQQHMISDDLAFLYRHYLTGSELTPHVLEALPEIMFKQELKLQPQMKKISGVIVDYSELDEELNYTVEDSRVCIDLFMDDYRILFEDVDGNRYMASVNCEIRPLLDTAAYIRDCYPVSRHHRLMVMNRSERALKYQLMDDDSIEVYKNVLKLGHVSLQYQKTVLRNLIDYYYDNYEGETLEKYLLQIDIRLLGNEERGHIIAYYIQRGLYERAYEAMETYGYDGIQDKWILKLASRMIREHSFAQDRMLTDLSYLAFEHGKYDEATLRYLIRFYQGPTANLYKLWKAAVDFEVPAPDLEERLLSQMLFAETMIQEGCEVLVSYYGANGMQRVTKAFLAYAAYNYLDRNTAISQQVFHIMEIELNQMDEARETCSLALIRWFSENRNIRPGYYGWLCREIAGFIDKDVILPWFSRFSGCGEVPSELTDLCFVSWRDKPGRRYMIEYTREGSDQPAKQIQLDNPVGGLYVKAFQLFAGEQLSYRILDEEGRETGQQGTLMPEQEARGKMQMTGKEEIDRMLDHLAFHDDLAMDEAMIEYERLDEMADQLFHLN